MKIKGIDLSKHNGDVNFAEVKAAGFDFAILRCGYRGWGDGVIRVDEKWHKYVADAIKNNMPYGMYFFSQAKTVLEAIEEARFVIKCAKEQNVQPLYPLYIDSEWSHTPHTGRADYLTKAERTAVVKAFCNEIERNGYYAGIYASKSWFSERLIDSELTIYDKWVAQYALKCTYKGAKGMWQYGGSINYLRNKKVNGVSSDACDQNYCYKDYPNIIKNAGLNGYCKTNITAKKFSVVATGQDLIAFESLAKSLNISDYTITEV